MPLFFFVSGLHFSPKSSFKKFLSNKAKNIVFPYFFFGVISYLALIPLKFTSNYFSNVDLKKSLLSLFYCSNTDHLKLIPNVALWFLTCLFSIYLFYYFINKIKSNFKKILVLFICSIIGYFLLTFCKIDLPWGMDRALSCIIFFGIAHIFRDYILNKFSNEKFNFLIPIFMLLIGATFAALNCKVNIADKILGNYVYFYASAFASIFLWIYLVKKIRFPKLINDLGEKSLILLSTHMLVFTYILSLSKKLNFPLSRSYADLLKLNPHCPPIISNIILILIAMFVFIIVANVYYKYIYSYINNFQYDKYYNKVKAFFNDRLFEN